MERLLSKQILKNNIQRLSKRIFIQLLLLQKNKKKNKTATVWAVCRINQITLNNYAFRFAWQLEVEMYLERQTKKSSSKIKKWYSK